MPLSGKMLGGLRWLKNHVTLEPMIAMLWVSDFCCMQLMYSWFRKIGISLERTTRRSPIKSLEEPE